MLTMSLGVRCVSSDCKRVTAWCVDDVGGGGNGAAATLTLSLCAAAVLCSRPSLRSATQSCIVSFKVARLVPMAYNEMELLGCDCFLFELSCKLDSVERLSSKAEDLRLLPDEFEMAEMGAEMDEWIEGVDGTDGGSVIVTSLAWCGQALSLSPSLLSSLMKQVNLTQLPKIDPMDGKHVSLLTHRT
jgi:hypothetical protein